MAKQFGKEALVAAFERIGRAAAEHGTLLDIAVYGGSALMLASNFRFSTEDVDIAALDTSWPGWLSDAVAAIADDNCWSSDWLNDAVQFHLSPLASRASDHVEFGTYPREGKPGLRVSVPSLDYMLALKLKAMRINDPAKGAREVEDIRALLTAARVRGIDEAIAILARFFPRSALTPERERFFLKHIWPDEGAEDGAPKYPR